MQVNTYEDYETLRTSKMAFLNIKRCRIKLKMYKFPKKN